LKFKAWLTVPEAARYLSILFGEDVAEADVLRLALDEHLALSVNFVNGASAQCSKIADEGPVATVSVEMSDEEAARWFEELRIAALDAPEEYGNGILYSPNVSVKYIMGIWDLMMEGATRANVENKYQSLSGGPAVDPLFLKGFGVNHPSGRNAVIVEPLSEEEIKDKKYDTLPDNHPSKYRPGEIPSDAVLIVRTSALQDLEAMLSEPEPGMERPIGQRERDNLLVIIAALAKLAKINVAKPSAAAAAIVGEAARTGIRIGLRTIEEKLKLIPDALERKGVEEETKGVED
jgi:hypothetical protein